MTNPAIAPETLEKEAALKKKLAEYGSIAIAYSGGVDSSYLADVAHETLGHGAHILIADSPSIPRDELAGAMSLAQERGWHLRILHTQEFEKEDFLKNDGRRCYHCKDELFTRMAEYARGHQVRVLAHGEIADDAEDPTRLGARAAREHAVAAPLAGVDLGKEEIRALSRRRKLPTWNKPSFACLSSRFPRGQRVAIGEMLKVERAEQVLKRLGFHQYRARHHGDTCRIEVEPRDFGRILDPAVREEIIADLTRAGYRHITLDLAGYRTGSTA